MKVVHWLQDLIKAAKANGSAVGKDGHFELFVSDAGREVTAVHYGVCILDVQGGGLVSVGGWSASDARYINNILSAFGINEYKAVKRGDDILIASAKGKVLDYCLK